jgi:H+/Cl- antiporter ClcA
MPPTGNSKRFWARVWREVEPILTHAIVVLFLVCSLIVVALVIIGLGKLIDRLVTNHINEYIPIIETIDFWLIIACLVLFGLYTIAIVGIRLFKEAKEEYRDRSPAEEREQP